MDEFSLCRIGRWQHSRTKMNGLYPPDKKALSLRVEIAYYGQDEDDARRRFLADHTMADVARWLGQMVWIDNHQQFYAGYVMFSGQHRKVLRVTFKRRDEQGRYLPGEDTRRLPFADRIERERGRVIASLAEQLWEEVASDRDRE